MFFDLFNEQHSGGTSLFVDFLSLSDQVGSSVSNPDEVFPGGVDFIVKMFFQSITFVSVLFIGIRNVV